jgi:CubicO group peptidase (beta-lactamase class C family)
MGGHNLGMKIRFIAILLSVVAMSAVAAPSKKELETRLDAYVAPLIEQNVFSGVVLLAKGDEVLLHRAYGNANYEFGVPSSTTTRYPIASITKPMTGVILRRLEHAKKLSLADPLAKYIPDFPSADKITLDHLRTHRSGLRDPEKLRRIIRQNFTTAEIVELLKTEPIASVPGETYSYTTANYTVLANVIEKVTGQSFAEVIRRYIFGPAGMADSGELARTTVVSRLASGYMPDPYGDGLSVSGPEDTSWKTGGGSSYSTTGDLHRFARALYSGKLTPGLDPRKVLLTSKMLEKDVHRSSGGFPGFSAHLLYFIDDEVSVVVLSNNYAPVTSGIADSVASMYFERPYAVPAAIKPLEKSPPAEEITGRYSMGTFPPFTISIRGGKPFLSWNPVRVSALVPIGPDTWFEKLDWLTLKAERDATGRVTGFSGTAPWTPTPMKVTRIE